MKDQGSVLRSWFSELISFFVLTKSVNCVSLKKNLLSQKNLKIMLTVMENCNSNVAPNIFQDCHWEVGN